MKDAKPLRLLMTADAVGGVWQYAMDLSRGLQAHAVGVHLAVMGPSPTDAHRQDAAAAGVTLHDAPFALEWMDDPWVEVDRAGEWLLDLERTIRPNVIHLNGYAHAALSWYAPVLVTGHSCVCSWWRAVHGDEAPPRFDIYRQRAAAGIQAAAAVVAPTADMLAALEREYGALPAPRVIPNGRLCDRTARVGKDAVIFAGGRLWDAAKNIETLCAAARDLEWPVFVAGETCDPSGACRPLDGVYPLGMLNRTEMQSWYARAMVYALPARYEPFGLSVVEAAQAGCALVLGDIRSLRENWDGAAVFVPPDNRRALRSALSRLMTDLDCRVGLAAAASARAARFTVEHMTDAYWSLYAELAAARGALH